MRNFPWLCMLSQLGFACTQAQTFELHNSATVLVIAKSFAAKNSCDVTVNTLH